MKKYGSITIMLLFSVVVFSQNIVKGVVKDINGRPILGGTSVSVKGKNRNVTTNYRAEFSIQADKGDVLIFKYSGYPTQEIKVENSNIINVVLKEKRPHQKPLKKGIRKVVFVLVDGISTDMYYKGNTPFLDAISKEGAFSPAYVGGKKGSYSETPTISAVGYNSLLTGVWVNKHNVFDNDIAVPNYNYPTIFRLLKNQNANKKIAVFSTWKDNRTKLIGEGLPETTYIKMDYSFDGLETDTKKFPHDKNKKYLKRIDGEVAKKAANYIYENGPDLSWVYLEHTDDMGHLFGESKQFYEALSYEDSLIGMIWDAVKLREEMTDENWLVIVTTDHGRRPFDGKHHGYQSERERSTWVAMSKPIDNMYFKNNNVAIVDIMPTIADFMQLKIPKKTAYEIDGISFMRTVDAFNLEGICIKQKYLHLKWLTEHLNSEQANVLISYTNNVKTGGEDKYHLLGTVDVKQKEVEFTILPPKKTKYAKVVLETKNHTVNTWVKIDETIARQPPKKARKFGS